MGPGYRAPEARSARRRRLGPYDDLNVERSLSAGTDAEVYALRIADLVVAAVGAVEVRRQHIDGQVDASPRRDGREDRQRGVVGHRISADEDDLVLIVPRARAVIAQAPHLGERLAGGDRVSSGRVTSATKPALSVQAEGGVGVGSDGGRVLAGRAAVGWLGGVPAGRSTAGTVLPAAGPMSVTVLAVASPQAPMCP